MSRGLRNNNPGNIRQSAVRYQGEIIPSTDTAFKQFKTVVWGYRALFMLLHTYQKKHGLNTLNGMIRRYAPPVENDTNGYVRAVCTRSGIAAERVINTLDGHTMIPVACAMSRVENGVEAVRKDVEAGWELFVQSLNA
ncbi:MAG: structural protein P5 [Rikenellaceae bacterium]|jgi:hypothetical protein|nr:structural protein P5 [Rikenellaceae bacterium]